MTQNRFLALLFVLVSSLAFAGCGKDDENNNNTIAQNNCQAGYVWNGSYCVPNTGGGNGNCPQGQYWNGFQCVVTGGGNGQCGIGMVWNGQTCVPTGGGGGQMSYCYTMQPMPTPMGMICGGTCAYNPYSHSCVPLQYSQWCYYDYYTRSMRCTY